MAYLPHTPDEVRLMLARIGVGSVDELFSDIPPEVRFNGSLDLPAPHTESEIVREFQRLCDLNRNVETRPCLLGAGAYRHFIPSVVDAVISRAEFATAYTPYQPEASQGTLQVIFEFQSMITRLTGLDVANASLYDGASAAAEAAALACSATGRNRVLVSRGLHPEYRAVLRTVFAAGKVKLEEVPLRDGATSLEALGDMLADDVAAFLVGDPNFLGVIEASDELARLVHDRGACLVVVNTDPTSLGLLRRPAAWGADVAVGEAASMGLPLSFGGPYVGFIAVKDDFVKRLPGRLVGMTVDQEGRRGFCLTLQTREQHIRREKATSNICTNQSLCALAVTVWLYALGPRGLREIASASARRARYALARLEETGVLKRRFQRSFYHEFVMTSEVEPARLNTMLADNGVVGGYALGTVYPEMPDALLFCATEVLGRADIDRVATLVTQMREPPRAQGQVRENSR